MGIAAVVTFGFMLIPMLATVLLGVAGGMPAYDVMTVEESGRQWMRATSGCSSPAG